MAAKKRAKKSFKKKTKHGTKKSKTLGPGQNRRAKKKTSKRSCASPQQSYRDIERGFTTKRKGIYIPDNSENFGENEKPIPASKLRKGIETAQQEINHIIENICECMPDGYKVGGFDIEVSFNAEGKFVGIGVGGATTIKLTIVPDD